jgi:cell wall-associated NlpC family hydrolase
MFSILAAVAVCFGTVTVSSRPATASVLGTDRARANQLLKQINRISSQVDLLGQKYDLAQVKLHKITFEIKNTKSEVATIKSNVNKSAKQLAADAVFAYVTNGSAASNNPLFTNSAAKIGSTNVYSQLAEGNITSTISSLKSYRLELTEERSILADEVGKATQLARGAAASFHSANVYQASLNHALSQVKGSIATYIAQAQAAANAATVTQFNSASLSDGMTNPPPDSKANIAIGAAESYIGVWYSWGGASRSGVDCSGLIMLAYEAAGIDFPHYSGAQYADTERVPLADIEPGDLLFYGYDGDQHVAMYVGDGKMIEAEMTGTQVHIVPVRLGYGFFGLGRPRG